MSSEQPNNNQKPNIDEIYEKIKRKNKERREKLQQSLDSLKLQQSLDSLKPKEKNLPNIESNKANNTTINISKNPLENKDNHF